ncbi:MAG: ABC transporter permease [Armatimonadota bacterium]|nr:ABC transporter permease [Armatimonadota bacterium]
MGAATVAAGSSLRRYAAGRLLQAVPLVLGVIVVNFLLIAMAPGDPVKTLLGEYPAPPEYVMQLRREFGLDQPVLVRLALYVRNVVTGNLGYSFAYRLPVATLVAERLGKTFVLMATALTLAAVIGVTLGVAAARRHGAGLNVVSTGVSLAGYSIPDFWLAQLLVLLFAVALGWLPAQGIRSVRQDYTGLAAILDLTRHLILPAVALSFRYMALIARLTRASMLEAMSQDFILAARARGVPERLVLLQHGLRNAALPVVTVIGYNFAFVLAGSALVETVFGWPGVGRLLYDAILQRDTPVLLGVLMMVSVTVVVVNLLVDLVYALLDPRVRY